MAARWGHAEVVTFFLLNIVDHTITNHRNETAHDVAPPEIKVRLEGRWWAGAGRVDGG